MSNLISKEVLSLVLGDKVELVESFAENTITVYVKSRPPRVINLDTLTRDLKERCLKKDYYLMIEHYPDGYIETLLAHDGVDLTTFGDYGDNVELVNMIKTVQWIAELEGL